MRGIKKAARKSNGLRRCNGCKFNALVTRHYYEEICDVCWKSFIDGFKKGAKFVERKNKENHEISFKKSRKDK